ncbi:MAG: LPS export ABC transporter permease LptG [Burkholderiaceae bacterium]|nr:LPS export ABC transporter permease LptG [Burkholderiaceae bacterium]
MKVITRQLTKEILLTTGFVLLALVGLFTFFELMSQIGRIGSRYTLWQALVITFMAVPMRVYEIMPIAALLGAVFVMSRWAASSEFTILRVAGLSPVRLAGMLMVPGLILVILTYGFGEFVAPPADQFSREYKAQLLKRKLSARGYSSGTWVREVLQKDGEKSEVRYINISNYRPGGEAYNWRVFDFDNQHLSRVITAPAARFVENQGWLLSKAVSTQLPTISDMRQEPIMETVKVTPPVSMMLKTEIGPNIFAIMMLKPENMSMSGLYQYIGHLKQSKQETGRYDIALWNKAFYPIAILVMIALSMPFAYMNTRSGGMSIKIFSGVMIGLGFYTVNNLFSYIGMLNTWPPLVVALLPTTIMLLIAMVAMWYVEKR